MIIGRYDIFDPGAFTAGLQRAIGGVLRVGVEATSGSTKREINSIASAWLITDTLAVICDYVLSTQSTRSSSKAKYFCYHPDEPEQPIEAEPLLDLPSGNRRLSTCVAASKRANYRPHFDSQVGEFWGGRACRGAAISPRQAAGKNEHWQAD